jgi:hypothetical protein
MSGYSNQSSVNQYTSYWATLDEVDQLAETSAVAPLVQSENHIVTWATNATGGSIGVTGSDRNLLVNSTVTLGLTGDFSSVRSVQFTSSTGPTGLYMNSSSLYFNGVVLGTGATGAAGSTGPTGAAGPTGAVGATGAAGPTGSVNFIPTSMQGVVHIGNGVTGPSPMLFVPGVILDGTYVTGMNGFSTGTGSYDVFQYNFATAVGPTGCTGNISLYVNDNTFIETILNISDATAKTDELPVGPFSFEAAQRFYFTYDGSLNENYLSWALVGTTNYP